MNQTGDWGNILHSGILPTLSPLHGPLQNKSGFVVVSSFALIQSFIKERGFWPSFLKSS